MQLNFSHLGKTTTNISSDWNIAKPILIACVADLNLLGDKMRELDNVDYANYIIIDESDESLLKNPLHEMVDLNKASVAQKR